MDRSVLNLGFRPFYLLASGFAAVYVAIWGLQYSGWLPGAFFAGPAWHAHEMLFGFTMAVIAGFLFTAVGNWTRQPTPMGLTLALVALLWIAGRVMVLTPWRCSSAWVNAMFPWAVAWLIAVPLVRAGNRRNYFFVALLAFAGVVTLCVHLAALGFLAWPQRASLQVGLDVVLFIVAVIGGRVIPMFTNNAIPGAGAARAPWVEKAALGSVAAILAFDLLALPFAGVVAAVAAVAHAIRLAKWHPLRTTKTPMVWILHASYAWIVIHFALRALAAVDLVSSTLATHALTIGVVGGMTLGMMTRTALGHTGRAIAADRGEMGCFVLIQAAAVVRVFGGIAMPGLYAAGVVASAVLWSAAFGWYFVRYWPVLTRPRVDGAPG